MEAKSNHVRLLSAKETEKFGIKLANEIKDGGLICLYGDLGSGKTTLSKGIAVGLNIDAFKVKSPTYTYMRKYDLEEQSFYHIDLYRLSGLDELMLNELNEILSEQKNIVVIEWAQRLQDHLPTQRIDVDLKYIDSNSRELTIDDKRRN